MIDRYNHLMWLTWNLTKVCIQIRKILAVFYYVCKWFHIIPTFSGKSGLYHTGHAVVWHYIIHLHVIVKRKQKLLICCVFRVLIAHRQWLLISFRTYILVYNIHKVYPTFLLGFTKIRILMDSWQHFEKFLQKAMPLMHLFSTKQLAKEKKIVNLTCWVFYCLIIHFVVYHTFSRF